MVYSARFWELSIDDSDFFVFCLPFLSLAGGLGLVSWCVVSAMTFRTFGNWAVCVASIMAFAQWQMLEVKFLATGQ